MFDLAQEIRASNGNPRQFAELPHGGANRGLQHSRWQHWADSVRNAQAFALVRQSAGKLEVHSQENPEHSSSVIRNCNVGIA